MHAINKTRDAKGLLKLWRCQPSQLMKKISKDFATKLWEAAYLERIHKNRIRDLQ